MEPEDFNNDYVPTEADFAEEIVDEKEELRKYIKKSYRFKKRLHLVFAFIMALLFFLSIDDWFSGENLWRMWFIIYALWMGYTAFYSGKICRADTASEMKRVYDRQAKCDKILAIAMFTLFIILAAVQMWDSCPWYVTLLVVVGMVALLGWLYWLIERPNSSLKSRDEDIERLLALEQEDEETVR